MVAAAVDTVVRRKERRIKELYHASDIIYEPEITPVLQGIYSMQGPVDEIDQSIQKNMVPPKTLRRYLRHYMSPKVHTTAESGTCNVCSAPCSSCMHLSIGQMGSKSEELCDETDHFAVTSQYSVNDDKAGDSSHHIPSEASNLVSVNSSHDSYSENIESKVTMRPSDVSGDIETHGTCSNKYNGLKGFEGNDDNVSFASRVSSANAESSYCNKDLDNKNSSRSSASVCSLGTGKVLSSQKLDFLELSSIKEEADAGSNLSGRGLNLTSGGIKSAVGGSSEISTKIHPKSESDIANNSGKPPDKSGKSLNNDEQDKSNELVELTDKQEFPLQSVSGDENYESDATEHDVKVCDICGDAGREDLLAICSKCSDGAEHTYCMREMVQKVPEVDWLCEECKLAEENENEKQGSDAEEKRANKLGSSSQTIGKRLAENQEGFPAQKRQAVEANMVSPKSMSASRVSSLSRENSFKNLDRGKMRPSPQISVGNHSGNDMLETACSPSSGPRLQTPKGTLLKSNSFNSLNSKLKVKLVDEIVLQKQKSFREHASLDTKEEPTRMMSKSMSFRSTNSKRYTVESKSRMLPSKYSNVQDLKGLKQVKERMSLERKTFPKLDRSSSTASTPKVDQKLKPRADAVSYSSTSNNRESKAVQSEGKSSTLSRSTSNLARKGVENAVISASGISSSNGRISSEQKLSQVSPKEEPSSSSWTAEKQPNNVNGVVSDGVSQSLDSTNQSEKYRESSVNHTKGVTCLKCKEIGHTAEYCSVSQVSSTDMPGPRNSREEINKGNKLKAAIEAAIRMKPGICERASQDPSSVLSKAKNAVEGTHEGQTNAWNQASVGDMKMLNSHSTDAVSVACSPENLPIRDISTLPLVMVTAISKISAIPEHEYVWQGAFEVHKNGRLPEIYGGIQAHLSSLASLKVLEVVDSFPQKVLLSEVPRLSTWPTQFHDSGPKEDNIALYFFAKDLESYDKNYKVLLDAMVKNDIALKGNFDGVELLIFPSNQLPENCQRWNTLFFLWGVFRGRRGNCSISSKGACIPDTSTIHLKGETSTDIPRSVYNESAACDSLRNVVEVTVTPENTSTLAEGISDNKVSSLGKTRVEIKAKLAEQEGKIDSKFLSRTATSVAQVHPEIKCITPLEEKKFPERRLETEVKGCLQAADSNADFVKVEKDEMHVREDVPSLKNLPSGNQEAKAVVGGSIVGKIGDPIEIKDSQDDGYADVKIYSKRDLDSLQSNHQKRPYLDLRESVPEITIDTSQQMSWSEVKGVSVGGGSDNKKLKTDFNGIYQFSNPIVQNPFIDSLASDKLGIGSCSSIEDKRCDVTSEEKVIPEDLGSGERFFFPVDSHPVREFLLGELSVKDEDRVHDVSPNLELALGAETRPATNKGILPFFVGSVDKNSSCDMPSGKVTGKEEEEDDDGSASLSLSLSFPFPEKGSNAKSVSKRDQLLPERHPVNTSLLLFRSYPEK